MSAQTVYAVERGAYSDWYVECLFTSKELADAYVVAELTARYEAFVAHSTDTVRAAWKFITGSESATPTFEQYVNGEGADLPRVGEYQLWDALPIAP